jgi:tRNA threonylcarbamoyladenosine biosynthesis protein TsaB
MNLLAIETATEACSVALMCGEHVIERFELAPRRHAELVLPMAEELLAQAGIGKRALDAIAVGRGPGAFTGVRLAIAVAQGLAIALDRPIVPVSTLAALALAASPHGGAAVLALLDARMGEVYAGLFEHDAAHSVRALAAEALVRPGDLVAPSERDWIAIGSGWSVYGEALRARLSRAPVAEFPSALPRAEHVARLGARDFRAGLAVDAALAQPVYLREKVALTSAERSAPA